MPGLAIAVICACMCQSGCSGGDDREHIAGIHLYTSVIEVESRAGERSVTLAATGDWTADTDESWIRLEPDSGSAGFAAVTVSYEANNTGRPRVGTVVFTSGGYTAGMELTQAE